MSINITSARQLENALAAKRVSVIKVYSNGCPPCMAYGPIFDQLANRYKSKREMQFLSVESSLGLAEVDYVPTTFFYVNGELDHDLTIEGGGDSNMQRVASTVNRLAQSL